MKKTLFAGIIAVFLAVALPVIPVYAESNPLDSSGKYSSVQIDGNFDDWTDKPFTWEYNWNNLPISGEGGYTTNSRHKISLFRDGDYVYLHIIMAKNWYNSLVGDDYEFTCDGVKTQFRITTSNGASINAGSFGAGVHAVQVRYGDGAVSGRVAENSAGMLKRQSGGINDELEIKIPVEDFHIEKPQINADTIKEISFFTPNLMMYGDRITAVGTSTLPFLNVALCVTSVGVISGAAAYKKRKKKSC